MWVDGSTQVLLNPYRDEDLLNLSLSQQESQWYIFLGSQFFKVRVHIWNLKNV